MVFRDDRQVLIERLAVLEREAEDGRHLRARVAELEADNRRLATALAELQARLQPPRPPPPPAHSPSGQRLLAMRVQGPSGIHDVTFDEDVIKIGRAPSVHLQLPHDDVSRLHAVIERSAEGFAIIDLGSSKGTVVNGETVAKRFLATGDVVTIGPFAISVAVR